MGDAAHHGVGDDEADEIAMGMDDYFRSMPSPTLHHPPSSALGMTHTEDSSDNDGPAAEEDAGIKAAMATLCNAGLGVRANPSAQLANNACDRKDPPEVGSAKLQAASSSGEKCQGSEHSLQESESPNEHNEADQGSSRKLTRRLSSTAAFDTDVETSEDEDIPVAVPVESTNDGEVAVDTTASSIKSRDDDGKGEVKGVEAEAKSLRLDASIPSPAKKARKKPGPKPGTRLGPRPGPKPGMSRSKSYQGHYRSAAAAHRHRQIYVPPIGSPGLLMMPTPAAMAAFPPVEDEGEARKRWLVREEYLLPATVFRQSMFAGGYTYAKRREKPHRGSSTERCVGDMFDSDAGGLYLHFPELIPLIIWERRLGDELAKTREEPPPIPLAKGTREGNAKKAKGVEDSSDAKKDGDGASKQKGPKGARSSYIFFTNAQRPKMVMEFPGMRFTEQGVIMGERWRALTPEDKKPYEDMANRDKERYAREMNEYIESVKQEIREEKEEKKKQLEDHGMHKEAEQGKQESPMKEEDQQKEELKEGSQGGKIEGKTPKKEKLWNECVSKGPRLVDAMILSLSNMLGQEVRRKEGGTVLLSEVKKQEPVLTTSSPEELASLGMMPEVPLSCVGTSGHNLETVTASNVADPLPHRVSPDLTPNELPQFTPSAARTMKRHRAHTPMSFLDMIPISLTSTYPPTYVAERRAYARAVRAREYAIIDSQEAKDDADEAQEKYMSHTEAWERMLEYQKNQIAKREVERKRLQGKEEREVVEKKEMEETKSEDGGTTGTPSSDGIGGEDKKEATSPNESISHDGSNMEKGDNRSTAITEEAKKPRPPIPPLEDPMECMPPRPQPPGPARIVSIPDIPNPPIPPPVVGMDDHDDDEGVDRNSDNDQVHRVESEDAKDHPMQAPTVDKKLVEHLDPSCFFPTMEGRYFGLLSNHISDPQFCGMMAPGISGTTYGGGTGLATSYVGGGRGAMGLVSGPVRGGNLWERQNSVGSRSSGIDRGEKTEGRQLLTKLDSTDETVHSRGQAALEAIVLKDVAITCQFGHSSSPSPKLLSTAPVSSSVKKKRPASDTSPKPSLSTVEKKKKQKRSTIGLATGDRNTSATEIASGSAGPEFPVGWIIKTYRRNGGETIGKTDRFWFSPGRNIRFRAKKHAQAFVEILSEPNIGGDEDKAAEIYRARGLHF